MELSFASFSGRCLQKNNKFLGLGVASCPLSWVTNEEINISAGEESSPPPLPLPVPAPTLLYTAATAAAPDAFLPHPAPHVFASLTACTSLWGQEEPLQGAAEAEDRACSPKHKHPAPDGEHQGLAEHQAFILYVLQGFCRRRCGHFKLCWSCV